MRSSGARFKATLAASNEAYTYFTY